MKHIIHSPTIREREPLGNKVTNLTRVHRTLKLIALLQEWKTNKEIRKALGIHERTVHRYLNMLVDLGFVVEWSWTRSQHIYRVTNTREVLSLE